MAPGVVAISWPCLTIAFAHGSCLWAKFPVMKRAVDVGGLERCDRSSNIPHSRQHRGEARLMLAFHASHPPKAVTVPGTACRLRSSFVGRVAFSSEHPQVRMTSTIAIRRSFFSQSDVSAFMLQSSDGRLRAIPTACFSLRRNCSGKCLARLPPLLGRSRDRNSHRPVNADSP